MLRASILVADRRWNLRLKNGIDVRLPETECRARARNAGRARSRQEAAVARHRRHRSAARRPRDRAAVGRRRAGARGRAQGQEAKRKRGATHERPPLRPHAEDEADLAEALGAGGRARCRHQQDRLPDRAAEAACAAGSAAPPQPRRRGARLRPTRARGVKAGAVVDLAEAEQAIRQAVDAAERMASRARSVVLSVSAGRSAASFSPPRSTCRAVGVGRRHRRVLRRRQPPFGARRPRRAAFAADRLLARRRQRHPRPARHARPPLRRRHACGDRRHRRWRAT